MCESYGMHLLLRLFSVPSWNIQYKYSFLFSQSCLLSRAHAQRGEVIGPVVVVVVVSTKIAKSRILGEFASANCS